MDCSIIYYIAYKTGYIQRSIKKKFDKTRDICITSTTAAVSTDDLCGKFSASIESAELIFVIGGLSAPEKNNVMTVLSEYFTEKDMEVTFNKKVVNPAGGKDGYLIKSGDKYIVVLPDEPEHIDSMLGSELMQNINITPNNSVDMPEPVRTHSIVFAPEPDYSRLEKKSRKPMSVLLKLCISFGIAVVAAAVLWVLWQLEIIF